MTYRERADCIIRLNDGARIPKDEGNRDYREYIAWIEEGGSPDVDPEPTQEELKAAAKDRLWGLIKIERERRQKAGVRVGSNWFHSDSDSHTQQLALVLSGSNMPSGLEWKTLGGSFVTMTPTLAVQILQASTTHDMAMFSYAEQLKASMQSMTLSQVLALDVKNGWVGNGWPETYEEPQ